MAKLDNIDNKILRILQSNPEGLRAKTIQNLAGIKQRTLYNHLKKLKENNILINIFPIWLLAKSYAKPHILAKLIDDQHKIQSHKFSFTLRLLDKPNWWEKRENKLIKLKDFNYKPVAFGKNKYEMLKKENFIIQTFSNSIVIINQKRYWGKEPYECFENALEDTLEIISFIEEKFNFKFLKDGIPNLTVRTHHYVRLKDAFAEKCKKQGNLVKIKIDGKLRAWIDLSEPFGLETGHKNYAVEDMSRYNKHISDIMKNNPPTNTELTSMLNSITENFHFYSENIVAHVEAIKSLSKGVKELRKEIKKINKNP